MSLKVVKQFRHREVANFLRYNPTAQAPYKLPNPFLPWKNPDTGKWAPAKYSMRRQADLVKTARKEGLLHLLPPGPKLAVREWVEAGGRAEASQVKPAETMSAVESSEVIEAQAEVLAEGQERTKKVWPNPRKDLWKSVIEWEGEVKEKAVPGAEVGNKLYAGKWRMFKGHKWERTREKRVRKREMLMKGMKSRILRFKSTYRKKRPNPLARPRNTGKSPKLPF
ncbi:hypothetical protein EIP86_000615 [Pleurotus ostreatoroseus]|nr:hypothetical protein EIP86_000615 [Pleurotus ostreatoroseus]